MSPHDEGDTGATKPANATAVVAAVEEDVPDVVRLHMSAFPGFFLTFLGPSFLGVLYANMIEFPDSVLLVAKSDGRSVGLVGGMVSERDFFRWLRQERKFLLIRSSITAVIKKPSTLARLWRARNREDQHDDDGSATLLTLAVDPLVQGGGIGRALVESFGLEMKRRGVASYRLTTDAVGNDSVLAFYRRQGLETQDSWVTPEGRAMLTMTKKL